MLLSSSRVRRALAIGVLVLALSACSTEDMIRAAFAERGATPAQQDQAIRVAHCESTHRWDAVSPGGGNWGLFQINTVHRGRVAAMGMSWDQMLMPYQNAQVAADLWAEQGWGPWTCARNLGIR
ncbi:MAG: transglycosylase SLT domain-containing protein [Acidimicrobiales bacterium]